jgi:hypothetical protein
MTTTINASTTAGLVQTADTSGALALQTANTTALTINSTQAIGVGSTPSFGTNGQVLTSGGSTASPTWTTISSTPTAISNGTSNVTVNSSGGTITATTAGTTAVTIQTNRHVTISGGDSAWLTVNPSLGATEGVALGYFYGSGSGDMLFQSMNQGGGSATNAGIKMGMNSTNSRSINARGTVNTNGSDYAEYMTKCSNFTVAKGDVVGIDVNGKLTNVFADAISFVVKSTDPSYVGGDTWSSPEALGLAELRPLDQSASDEVKAKYAEDKAIFDTALETARQLVDRIAFSGQVPVNVIGATAGQYIIPVNDNGSIKGQAVSNPTFEQYQIAVGKVISIESDGRAKIIVKVA